MWKFGFANVIYTYTTGPKLLSIHGCLIEVILSLMLLCVFLFKSSKPDKQECQTKGQTNTSEGVAMDFVGAN